MLTYMTKLQAALRRFAKNSDGTIAVESVIMLPILFWAFLASYVYFDAYRQVTINIKANYAIGDLLSRETASINDSYVDSMETLFDLLTKGCESKKIRLTVSYWDEEDDMFKLSWSEARGGATALNEDGINAMANKLPSLPDNEYIIVVETWSRYTPAFEVGLDESDLYNLSFTSPRFAPQLAWERNY